MSIQNKELEMIEFDRPGTKGKNDMGRNRYPVRGMSPDGRRAYGGSVSRRQSGRFRKKERRRQRNIHIFLALLAMIFLLLLARAVTLFVGLYMFPSETEEFLKEQEGNEAYPEKLLELLDKNEETLEFVKDYPNRKKYMGKTIDLSNEVSAGEVPLLLQWDRRWGYDSYGEGMIALEGCGPTCLSMAYIFLTGDTEMNPRKMAEFAWEHGYYSPEGTSWSLWTEGASALGLSGEELPLGESNIKQMLDLGGVVVCSMRPGDFTTTGHFILIRGYDEKGFFVNDPNRKSNSEKQWDFETLKGQIKNLWGISR